MLSIESNEPQEFNSDTRFKKIPIIQQFDMNVTPTFPFIKFFNISKEIGSAEKY